MDKDESLMALAVSHIRQLINSPSPPPLPGELNNVKELKELHETIMGLREVLWHFSRGEVSKKIETRGFMAGALKSMQAHLRHLTWQVQQVEKGDFSQRVEFLGDFSIAFNNMVTRLDNTLSTLKKNEDTLRELNNALQKEVNLRSAAVQALRQSEAEFKYLSEHDSLTGVYNRRSFITTAIGLLQEAGKLDLPCCLAIMDVDYFKRFNDAYGHLAGDAALKHVVDISTASLRQTDIMGRYGGEEFTFVFGRTDLEQGMGAAERIRKTLETSPVLLEDGCTANITVSIGLVCIKPNKKQARDFLFLQRYIQAADSALYEAKEKGRNQVRFAEAPTTVDSKNVCLAHE